MTRSRTLIDLSDRYTDSQHSTGDHETAHALLAEHLGIAFRKVSVIRDGDAAGFIDPGGADGLWPADSREMLVMVLAGYQGTVASVQGGNAAGAGADFEHAHKLALRLSDGDEDQASELIAEAHERAAELIADENYERVHDTVKRQLMERGSLTAMELGEVVARAKVDLAGGRHLTRGRLTDLRGDEGPAEAAWKRQQAEADLQKELAVRAECLQEIGAVKRPAATTTRPAPPKKPKREAAPGFGSLSGWVAKETFEARIDGKPLRIIAGTTWLRDGHEAVRLHPAKFRPATAGDRTVPKSSKTSPQS